MIAVLLALTALADDPTPLPGTALTGPFPTLTAACGPCTVDRTLQESTNRRVVLLADDSYSEFPGPPLVRYRLAMHGPAGWYVGEDLGSSGQRCGGNAPFFTSWRVLEWRQVDAVPGGGSETWLVAETGVFDPDGDRVSDRRAWVCGLRDDGVPSCASLFLARRRDGRTEWERTATVRGDGTVVVHDGATDEARRLQL